jgi:hypothetical protein
VQEGVHEFVSDMKLKKKTGDLLTEHGFATHCDYD